MSAKDQVSIVCVIETMREFENYFLAYIEQNVCSVVLVTTNKYAILDKSINFDYPSNPVRKSFRGSTIAFRLPMYTRVNNFADIIGAIRYLGLVYFPVSLNESSQTSSQLI